MKYMGSKARIAKYILPIILKNRKDGQYYIENFCGGCNTIDKVTGKRIATDSNPYLIALLQRLQQEENIDLPIDRELYNVVREAYKSKENLYPQWFTGLIGYCAGFNGRFFDGGYSGKIKTKKGKIRDYTEESIKGLKKQAPNLKGILFHCCDYTETPIPDNSIIYCDPPYKGVAKYHNSLHFDYPSFWEWCREKSTEGHTIYISGYEAPEDFICIWEYPLKTTMNPNDTKYPVEKLFILPIKK